MGGCAHVEILATYGPAHELAPHHVEWCVSVSIGDRGVVCASIVAPRPGPRQRAARPVALVEPREMDLGHDRVPHSGEVPSVLELVDQLTTRRWWVVALHRVDSGMEHTSF